MPHCLPGPTPTQNFHSRHRRPSFSAIKRFVRCARAPSRAPLLQKRLYNCAPTQLKVYRRCVFFARPPRSLSRIERKSKKNSLGGRKKIFLLQRVKVGIFRNFFTIFWCKFFFFLLYRVPDSYIIRKVFELLLKRVTIFLLEFVSTSNKKVYIYVRLESKRFNIISFLSLSIELKRYAFFLGRLVNFLIRRVNKNF